METQIGNYELLTEIGKGGMGVVYLARHIETGERVAVKVLPPELTRSPKYVERFRREATAVARLDHPNIIKVFDVGEENGIHFFAMEYLGGQSLRSFLKQRGKLPPADAVKIILDIADALELAHSQGIVHRDVKPDNIMSDESGAFKIMDFGIAHTEVGTQLTVTGTIMGTPEYMSPEQASGLKVDRRSDIYSLGIVLYEMLTGKAPFRGDTAIEVLQMHVTKTPESPKLLNPEIPGKLAEVVSRMLEKQPANRYDSFRHVCNALSMALPESMRTRIQAKPREIQPQVSRQRARPEPRVRERVVLKTPPGMWYALAASLIANLLLVGYILIAPGALPEPSQPAEPAFAIRGRMFAPPVVADDTLYLASEDGVVYAQNLASGETLWKFTAGDKITGAPIVDGERVYVGSWDQHVYALNASNGSVIWKTNIGGCVFSTPALSDGTLYVCTREGKVFALDINSGKERWNARSKTATRFAPAIHGNALLVASEEGKLHAYSLADGRLLGSLSTERMKSPAIPNGQAAYYVTYNDAAGRDELRSALVGQLPFFRETAARGLE
ncbi:MAG: hypothetical protein Kow0099_37550 [Candidatus Abyssubacteria bacterium]